MKCDKVRLSQIGLLERLPGGNEVVWLYASEKEREDAWNTLTPYGRESKGLKRCTVTIGLSENGTKED